MKYRVVFAPAAVEDFRNLPANRRTEVKDAVNRHLVHEPTRLSRSRTKRLRGTRRPQYRLRVGDVRVFYDVRAYQVEVLAVVEKSKVAEWLARTGEFDEEGSAS